MIYTDNMVRKEFLSTLDSLKARGYAVDPSVESPYKNVPLYAMLHKGQDTAVVCFHKDKEAGTAVLNCTFAVPGRGAKHYTLLNLFRIGPKAVDGVYTNNKAEAEAYDQRIINKNKNLGRGCDRAVQCCW